METRVDPNKLKRTFQLLGFDGFCCSNVNGFAGGIVVAWKTEVVQLVVVNITFQFIQLKVSYVGEPEWYLTALYASPNDEMRQQMWDDLVVIAQNMPSKWLLIGDFNDIAYGHEKKGGGPLPLVKMKKFVDNIERCKLMDIGSFGTKFT